MVDWDDPEPATLPGDVVRRRTAPDLRKHLTLPQQVALRDVLLALRAVAESHMPAGASTVELEYQFHDETGDADSIKATGMAIYRT